MGQFFDEFTHREPNSLFFGTCEDDSHFASCSSSFAEGLVHAVDVTLATIEDKRNRWKHDFGDIGVILLMDETLHHLGC